MELFVHSFIHSCTHAFIHVAIRHGFTYDPIGPVPDASSRKEEFSRSHYAQGQSDAGGRAVNSDCLLRAP